VSSSVVVLLIVLVGFQFAAQAPINGGLGRTIGPLAAALVSFAVGSAALFLVCLVLGDLSSLARIWDAAHWQLLGGLIGASYVALATIAVSRIGAGVIAAVTVTGQLACSVVVDHFGWFGIEMHDVTGTRVLGIALLLIGALAMLYSRESGATGTGPSGGLRGMLSGEDNRERLILCGAVFVASLGVGIQHPLNSELAVTIGDFPAGLVSFLAGTALLLAVVAASGRAVGFRRVREAEKKYFVGGLIGAVVVVASLSAVTRIGAAGLTASLITGQMIGSLVLDRVGAFGLTRIPVDRIRICAAIALLAGTFLATG